MKNINTIKKINIIIILILAIVIVLPNYSQATIGGIFSNADEFLGKRKFNREHNKCNSTTRNIKFHV